MMESRALWLSALWKAGVALAEYGSRERELFKALGGSFNFDFDLVFSSVTLEDRPDRWTIELRMITRLEVFQLNSPSGAWTLETPFPTRIL
jgi:hypothetical protein